MQRPHARIRAWLGAAALIATATACVHGIAGTDAVARGTLELHANFQANATAQVDDDITRVRLVVSRVSPAPARVIADVSQDFTDSDTADVRLGAEFPLQGPGAVYEVTVKAMDAQRDTLIQLGPLRFGDLEVHGGVVTLTVDEREVRYVGPGAEAVRVVASRDTVTMTQGTSLQLTADAFGPTGPALARSLFDWFVIAGNTASVDGTGMVHALGPRGLSFVVVSVPNALNPKDTVRIFVVLPPTQLQLRSGGGQTAAAGAQLANPVVVRVGAFDGTPVPDVTVRFAGPGVVNPATAVTAADGTAQTRWTLGTTAGAQTLTVTVTGLPALTVPATAR